MSPEALLYTRIREALGVSWDAQRIENLIGRGMPDITVSNVLTGDIWIEAKAEDHRKPLIRPEQYAWMKRRSHFSGKCCIITQRKADRQWFIWVVDDRAWFTPVGSYVIPKYAPTEGPRLDSLLHKLYDNSSKPTS